jgi:Xaa-Pro aminopeptidase
MATHRDQPPAANEPSEHPGRSERLACIRAALSDKDLTAVICSRDVHVLMLSGYWPVTGSAVAIATAEPRVILLVPEDAQHLAARGWADEVHTFETASLTSLQDAWSGLAAALKTALPALNGRGARLGYEAGAAYLPAAYVSQQVYGSLLPKLLQETVPDAAILPADELLKGLLMRPTAWERERIRTACEVAACAYKEAAPGMQRGVPETDTVLPFQRALRLASTRHKDIVRADGFFYCMSGPNAALAFAAFQQSRPEPIAAGEPVLIHCNSYVDGYWTDLTRTYVLGEPDARLRRMFDAVAAARAAAFDAIRPGAHACDVDKAARSVLADAGYGEAFRHATGHGVGFNAIDHSAWPRIHPCSEEVLEEGMIFNVEPAIYIEGVGGVRDCNMVAVTAGGDELLSPFHLTRDEWCISA